MLSVYSCKTKKDLKAPYERKWYATVTVGADGRVVKVD